MVKLKYTAEELREEMKAELGRIFENANEAREQYIEALQQAYPKAAEYLLNSDETLLPELQLRYRKAYDSNIGYAEENQNEITELDVVFHKCCALEKAIADAAGVPVEQIGGKDVYYDPDSEEVRRIDELPSVRRYSRAELLNVFVKYNTHPWAGAFNRVLHTYLLNKLSSNEQR